MVFADIIGAMRILFKLLRKVLMKGFMMLFMIFLMGAVMRYGPRYIMKTPGAAGVAEAPKFSSEETDLMSTVFKSGLKLFTGQASRKELAGELSDKLYAGRDKETMKELGIEMVSPADSADSKPGLGNLLPGAGATANQPVPSSAPTSHTPDPPASPAKPTPRKKTNAPANPAADGNPLDALNPLAGGKLPTDAVNTALLDRLWKQIKANSIELGLVPVVLLGMILVQRIRNRRSGGEEFMLPTLGLQTPADTEPYDMKHGVHDLDVEEFELLVALIYQRQGYRVSMPSALSGGRGGDFTLLRKAERILVQCKKASPDHRVPVERIRELREAMNILGLPRGMYVAPCGFSWDARNYGKANGITLINARILDELLTAARETPDEDLLSVPSWVGKLVGKVQFTPPECPACGAEMDLVSSGIGSAWLCTQRPDCRGRRHARKYQKSSAAAAPKGNSADAAAVADMASSQGEVPVQETAPKRSEAVKPREAAKPADLQKPASALTPGTTAQPAATPKPRPSGVKRADQITHENPQRQAELQRMAQIAGQAIAAKQKARAREEARAAKASASKVNEPSPSTAASQNKPVVAAVPVNQARQTTPAAPASVARPAAPTAAPANRVPQSPATKPTVPATPGNRPAQVPPVSPAVPATPGNRPTQPPASSRVVPATPGNRPEQAPPARQTAPATPGNRPAQPPPASRTVPATPGNRPEQAPPPPTRRIVPATPGNRPPQANPVRKVVPATPGNRPNS